MAHEAHLHTKQLSDKEDPEFWKHLEAIGLSTIDQYRDWCAENGFSRRINKHWRERCKERSFANRAAADARLAQKKSEVRKPDKAIQSIFRDEVAEEHVTHPHLKEICRAYKASQHCRRTKRALQSLLLHVGKHANLFDGRSVIPEYGRLPGNTFIAGLLALARQSTGWVRPLEDWKPRTHNPRRQFSALARHLLAEWPIPAFMDSVWFKGASETAVQQQNWFWHLGRGQSIRTADLPLPYTKRMAHHFMQAPPDLTVEAALRWGQIHGLGGNERLVRAIMGTRLASNFEHDDFWITVLRFLIENPMLDTANIGPIIDYIQHQKFSSQDIFVAPRVVEQRPPPQPNFTLKGRTPASLLRQVESWHHTLAKTRQPQAEWGRAGILPFEFIEGSEQSRNVRIWTITELLSTKALVAEGRLMKHCVATYSRSCAHGASSIWSMEVESSEGRRKILTLEVNKGAKLICQARGKCNARPSEKHIQILRRWAEQAGLRLAAYV
jgi:hypothetical protein